MSNTNYLHVSVDAFQSKMNTFESPVIEAISVSA